MFLGPILSPFTYDQVDWAYFLSPPSLSSGHVFGTDSNGRDLFVRCLVGGQISLTIGLVSSLVSLVIFL